MNKIHEYYYNEITQILHIEFSTKEDGDDFYRELNLDVNSVIYYSPTIINESDMSDIDNEFVIELIDQYLLDNELPEQKNL
jgi:hypothetical protein